VLFSRALTPITLTLALLVAGSIAFLGQGNAPDVAVESNPVESARAERLRSTLAAAPTPTPDLRGQPWILDIERREARPLNFAPPVDFNPRVFGFAAWVEDGESILGLWAGTYGVVDVSGKVKASIAAPQGGLIPGVIALPGAGGNAVLVWRIKTGDLSLYDVDTNTERTIASLPGAYDFSLSPDGSTLAFTRKRATALDIELMTVADGRERLLLTIPGENAAASHIHWSPDGRSMLLMLGTASYLEDGYRIRGQFDHYAVVDLKGQVVWEGPVSHTLSAVIRVLWGGPGRLFVVTDGSTSAPAFTEGYFLTPASGSRSDSMRFDGWLRCLSPTGNLAVLTTDAGNALVLDLLGKQPPLEVNVGAVGYCGWSRDETLLILSSGGV